MKRLLASVLVLVACSTTTEDEILADWVEVALSGDLASAEGLMIDDLAFPLGVSASSWIDGAEPFESREITVDCAPDDVNTSCEATWRDSWIDGLGEIDNGVVAITGSVEDGLVVSIWSVDFDPALRFGLNEHAAWLQANRRADFDQHCLDDVFARACSELLVATVVEWQGSSGE